MSGINDDSSKKILSEHAQKNLAAHIVELQELSKPHPSLKVRILSESNDKKNAPDVFLALRYTILGTCIIAALLFSPASWNSTHSPRVGPEISTNEYTALLETSFEFELFDDDFVLLEELL